MKKILLILLLLPFIVFSQKYSNNNRTFEFKGVEYQIESEEVDENLNASNYVVIKNPNKTETKIKLNFKNEEYDMISFGEYINDVRKFVIIQARYSFVILNLYNNKIIGPFSPVFYGIGQDAQSGMLSGMQIIFDGRFIIGYCVDSGAFLFDLTDLYNPKEEYPASVPYNNVNRVFILPHLEQKDKSFGLFISVDSWEVTYKYLFVEKDVAINFFYDIDPYNEEQFEKYYGNSPEIQYTIIEEYILDEIDFIVVNNYSGEIIAIPEKQIISEREDLLEYLKNLN
ncbi:MAG: hypothetical protein JXL97_20055 [Bacteroidales bacterium]|nr:hypothetical protein [Bacteroidales bacterium]